MGSKQLQKYEYKILDLEESVASRNQMFLFLRFSAMQIPQYYSLYVISTYFRVLFDPDVYYGTTPLKF
jgi:hypothetical protein